MQAAVQLLTILPAGRVTVGPSDLGRSVTYFPVVGLLLGWALAWLGWLGSRLWPAGVGAGLVLAAWIVLTGALHMDGLLDACDGLWGGRTVEDRLRILRDEHVGAYAVLGGVLVVLIDHAALASLAEPAPALLLAPLIGRWSMVLAVALFPYARPEGLGRAIKDHAGVASLLAASGFTVGCAWLVEGWRGLDCVAGALVVTAVLGRLVERRLSGWTGDLYGALCVLVEMMVLLVHAVRPP
jgi:adenosylcobinamide-GDP ribazoletransferase